MRENFITAERYNHEILSLHFVFAVNYIRNKNALYGKWISLFNRGQTTLHVFTLVLFRVSYQRSSVVKSGR